MADLPEQLPHARLAEVIPGVFHVRGQTRPEFGGQTLQFSRAMTVVRDGADLTLVNTLRLDEPGLSRLDALGTVRNIVKLGAFHGRDDAFYRQRYGATLWSFAGMPHERGVETDRELSTDGPGPISDASAFRFETSSTVEGVLVLERSDGVVLSCDSLQNMLGPDEYFDDSTAQQMKAGGFFGRANIGPGWLRAAKPQRSDFDRLLERSFKHLVSAHGGPLLDEAHQAIRERVDAVYGT